MAKPPKKPPPPPGVDANLLADMLKWAKAAGADSAEAFYINGESLSVAQRLGNALPISAHDLIPDGTCLRPSPPCLPLARRDHDAPLE